jgi:hypothetical protein
MKIPSIRKSNFAVDHEWEGFPVLENGWFRSNLPTTTACLILSFIAAPRILLNCPGVLRRLRVLPDL